MFGKIEFKEDVVGIQIEVEKEREENQKKINGNEGHKNERKNEHIFDQIKKRQTHGHPDKKSTEGKRRQIDFILI